MQGTTLQISDYWFCVTIGEILPRVQRMSSSLHVKEKQFLATNNLLGLVIGRCRLVTWRHLFNYVYRLYFYVWQLTQSTITCDFKITSERTIVLNANHYCISNVNYFFNIKFTYFRIRVFFREWRKPRAKQVIFVSLISTILFLYFYLLTYPRLFFREWKKQWAVHVKHNLQQSLLSNSLLMSGRWPLQEKYVQIL